MNSDYILNRGDRIAIAGVIAGFAGTLAAMALPFSYPNLPTWVWRSIFWLSLPILVGAIGFLIFDLLIRRKKVPLWHSWKWAAAGLLSLASIVRAFYSSGSISSWLPQKQILA